VKIGGKKATGLGKIETSCQKEELVRPIPHNLGGRALPKEGVFKNVEKRGENVVDFFWGGGNCSPLTRGKNLVRG